MEHHDGYQLNDHEKAQVAMQVEFFLEVLSKRYKIEVSDIQDAVRYVQEHRKMAENIKHGSAVTILGIVAGALAMSIWEGIKAALWKH